MIFRKPIRQDSMPAARNVAAAFCRRKPRAFSVAGALAGLVLLLAVLGPSAFAQVGDEGAVSLPGLNARKIFFMLFLMIGPVKILVPFVNMTRDTEAAFRRRLATRAILFSAAALAVAGVLGRSMLDNFNISVPVLALTGGLILFLVALQTVLHPSAGPVPAKSDGPTAQMSLAFSPLAFPTIVTPYGVAAVIVFAALTQDNASARLTLAGVVLGILVLDWLVMLYAEPILKGLGAALMIFAVVLGVTQIALGLQIMLRSLIMIGVLPEPAG